MAEMRTEEEQIEAIKNWWQENGRSTILGILFAALAVFGWRGWQDYQRETAEAASVLYQSLANQAQTQPGQPLSAEQLKSARFVAEQLKTDYQSSSYASFAALWLAKLAADQGQFDAALTELQWLQGRELSEELKQIVSLRLAQLLLATDQAEQGLQQLGAAPLTGFETAYYELKGDLLLALGKEAEAKEAYAKADQNNQDNSRPLVSMKLDNLAGVN